MTFEEFKYFFGRLLRNKQFYETLNQQYPSTYSTLIIDDEYVNDTLMLNDFLLQELLPNHFDCIMWFLWDWKPGFSIKKDGIEYIINSKEDYLAYKEKYWDK